MRLRLVLMTQTRWLAGHIAVAIVVENCPLLYTKTSFILNSTYDHIKF